MTRQALGHAMPAVTGPVPGQLVLQRKCACGTHTVGGDKCEACESKKRVLQRRGEGSDVRDAAPRAVFDVLRSPGQPLDQPSRSFMQSGFGRDFSRVRIHTDASAAASARAVNALAYTVGRDIVFDTGRYAPRTLEGRHLLAHELAHVVQQGSGSVTAKSALSVLPAGDASEREADASADRVLGGSNNTPVALSSVTPSVQRKCFSGPIPTVSGCTAVEGDLSGEHFLFAAGCDDFRTDTSRVPIPGFPAGEEGALQAFASTLNAGDKLKVHGFASEEGDATFNEHLSCLRALKAVSVIDAQTASRGVRVSYQLFKHGETGGPRPERRSVVIDLIPATPPDRPPVAPPAFVCGPDVTAQVKDVCALTRSTFGGWKPAEQAGACHALNSLITGGYAWDIVDLHNNAWILKYRPACASAGAAPACGSSVEVLNECHYAGSVNYVIFGVMCKLCQDHFKSIGSSDASDYTEAEMLSLINKYKGTGFSGFQTPSANFGPSQAWAKAGFQDWPAVASPTGDRPNCSASCATPYSGSAFSVHWVPQGVF